MREKRNAYRLLVGKPEGKRPLGRPRRRWVDNIQFGGIVKSKFVTNILNKSWIYADSLDKRPKLWGMDVRFGTWNVRSLYRTGFLKTVSKELARYKLDLVGMQVRWEGGGIEPAGEYTFLMERGMRIMN
jgi:hypothetical protein